VFEYDLGDEPEFDDLTLINEDAVRGFESAAIEPLKGRVGVGGPRGFKMTVSQVLASDELRGLIDPDSDQFDFYYVRLSVSFTTHDGPRLESAQVKLALAAVPEAASPFALTIRPSTQGTEIQVERTASFSPKFSVPNVGDVEAGGYENHQTFQRTRLFVRGLGLDGSTPGWEFTRTPGQQLEGSCRLELIVQAARGAKISVRGVVTAQASVGGLPWHFRANLPRPLTFSAAI
jgi:hypothetical protein